MPIKFSIAIVITLLFSIISCKDSPKDDIAYLQTLNDSIKKVFAPDKRVAIYDITVSAKEDHIKITGETDQEKSVTTLIDLIRSKGGKVENLVNILPDSSVGQWKHALVNNSVANIRSAAKHSGELATQAILGTSLKILKIDGDFYLAQTPDGYISWVDHGGVTLITSDQLSSWEKAPKVIFTNAFGHVYSNADSEFEKTGDIVLGSQLILLEEKGKYYKVQYPDKREGYLKKSESQPYDEWINDLQASGSLLELYAKELLGVPYLWGGTSTKGMDCSGFTKTVYLMNGYVIPRDASQQITAGNDVDPELQLQNLQKGDLMFFGKKATDSTRQRVTHVGIWLGNNKGEFIHASGRVKIGSIDPDSNYYDEFNRNRYLGSRRYLGEKDALIIDLKRIENKAQIKS
jgi:cell wall-associated NlpC family hydrolase